MHRCEDCKIILDNDVKHCPKCGKEVASGAVTQAASDPIMDATRLLAATNLHKFRSEWDEAISAATDALRLEPRNPDVTLALGGIYEEREMLDEALVWYQMTLELDEDNRQGKAGRDRVGMLMSARRKQAAAAPPKDPAKRARQYAIGAAAAIVLVIIGLVISLAMKTDRSRPTVASSSRRDLSPPISQPFSKHEPRRSAPKPSALPLSGETAPTAASTPASGLRTKAEQVIKDGLASAQPVTATGATIDDVIADPRAAVATVTFSLPAKGIVTKDQITRAAVAIARQTFELHQAVRFVTTRCVVLVPGAEGTQLAFVADVARQSVTPTATDQQIAAALNHPWWNPQVK